MSSGVGCRCASDPALQWLWRRPVATALIQSLTWEPPYATGVAQEMAKKRQKKKIKYAEKNGSPSSDVMLLWLWHRPAAVALI